jgi:oligopeptide/dipeptide ABC transporter ATP-binding protein
MTLAANLPAPTDQPPPAEAKAPILRVENLSVVFDRFGGEPHRALRGIDLEILPGEMVGLVGESGSGKTTLARCIMGTVAQPGRVEAGQVVFAGRVFTALPEDERQAILGRDLSMIVPNPRSELNPVLSVGTQVANIIRYHRGVGTTAARKAALEMLRAVRIPDPERRMDAYPHELSGGMAQRVVIAMALACSPRFVISDDATSGLDVTVQTQVLDLMAGLVKSQGASALFITRDIAIAAHFCSRIVILYAGEIVEIAETVGFFDRPTHPYSILLLAAFAHNEALRQRWAAAPADLPDACACTFAPRCVRRRSRCVTEHPALRPLADGRRVRCHYPVEG